MCHLILLMPAISLVVFWIWPFSVAGPVYALITVLSLWMYYYIWRAMQRPVMAGAEELLHSEGEVVNIEGNTLRVRVHSEMWNAESTDALQLGDHIKVVGKSGLVLRVKRLDDTAG